MKIKDQSQDKVRKIWFQQSQKNDKNPNQVKNHLSILTQITFQRKDLKECHRVGVFFFKTDQKSWKDSNNAKRSIAIIITIPLRPTKIKKTFWKLNWQANLIILQIQGKMTSFRHRTLLSAQLREVRAKLCHLADSLPQSCRTWAYLKYTNTKIWGSSQCITMIHPTLRLHLMTVLIAYRGLKIGSAELLRWLHNSISTVYKLKSLNFLNKRSSNQIMLSKLISKFLKDKGSD